jgi:hypothetical protein
MDMIDTVLVPADRTEEIDYTGGTWSDVDDANFKFGRAKVTSTAGDTAVLSFSGVSCAINVNTNTSFRYYFTAEYSDDGGLTWKNKKILSSRVGSTTYNITYILYEGLPYGDYLVRITNKLSGTSTLSISYFQYTTYMIQRPIVQYLDDSGGAKTVAEAPPLTTVLNGTFNNKNVVGTDFWNSTYTISETENATYEFKFYGSKIWTNAMWNGNRNIDISVLIDGVTTYNLSNTFNTDTGAITSIPQGSWIRLDNGSLPEGIHTVKLTLGPASASQVFSTSGFAYYTANNVNTLCRPLICGKNSYAVGIDDAGFVPTGTGWQANTDLAVAFLRRIKRADTNGDYIEYTLPNNVNLKAVHLLTYDNSVSGEVKITLDPSGTPVIRYLSNYIGGTLGNIKTLFDSDIDSVTLANKVLRIEKNGGTNMYIGGLVFEIEDASTGNVELNSIFVMPKFQRYNNSQNEKCPVSNSYRLEVTGQKTDTSEGRKPMVHTGWVYKGTGTFVYMRFGIPMIHVMRMLGTLPKDSGAFDDEGAAGDIVRSTFYKDEDLGLFEFAGSSTANVWAKIIGYPDHVV